MAIQERRENPRNSKNGIHERVATGLGWFSIGLGLAEVLAPDKVAELIGINDGDRTRAVLRSYGLREITAGIGILSQSQSAGWLWARVAGDVLDLASLGKVLASGNADRTRVATATAAVLGVTALDVFCGQKLSRGAGRGSAAETTARLRKSIIVDRPPEEVYRYWRNFENLANIMEHLESVRVTGPGRSHWIAKGPAGVKVEWDAEIVDDEPNALIAWRSLEGSDMYNSGTVRFERATGGRGTLLRVEMHYAPPGGAVSAKIAKLLGAVPEQQLENDLRRFRQVIETGEVVRSDASIFPTMHPAQPPAEVPELVAAY